MKSKHTTTKIEREWLTMHPSLTHDTENGKPITQGSLWMQIHVGTCKTRHKGKPVEINIGCSGTLILNSGKRFCTLNLKRLIQEALKYGLCADTLDFPEPKADK